MPGSPVALVSMPWAFLEFPSIALGILDRVLQASGIEPRIHSYNLEFMDFVARAEPVTLADYQEIAQTSPGCGLGDWIFALPPFRDPSAEEDARYLELTRDKVDRPALLETAQRLRALVPAFVERCAQRLLAQEPALVGFTTTFNQNVSSLLLARMLKQRNPGIITVFGGANCDGPMGQAMHRAFPWVDVVVQGEGETVVGDLFQRLLEGKGVFPADNVLVRPALAARHSLRRGPPPPARPRMDDVPTPFYDFYFETLEGCAFRDDLRPAVRMLVETARGCWWGEKQHCTFCGLNGSSMAFRSKSPQHALDDFLTLARRHRCLDFSAVDNIIELGYLRDLLPRLREEGLDLRIFYETKSNLTRQQVRDMRAAGIDHIQPGIESLSTPILKLMRKGVTAWQNVQLLKWCALYGVRVSWNMLYGFPREPPEEYQRVAEVIPSLTHLPPPSFNRLRVQRFSPYHHQPGELGVGLRGPREHYRFVYPISGADLEDLAYDFEFVHLDGRDPESYVEPARRAVEAWQAAHERHRGALVYRVGPGFIRIVDTREQYISYVLEDDQAVAYLACDAGATPAMVHRAVVSAGYSSLTVEDVRGFLDDLVEARLMFTSDGRFVSLALPTSLEHEPSRTIAALAPPASREVRLPA